MSRIVECVPNFSEGRRPEVYLSIVKAIESVAGIQLLNIHADPDHNRTVVTFIGTPQAVAEAAFRAIQRAAQLIDLNSHNGVHPRIGATDVCPFIPVQGVTMAECVALARQVGERVGRELGIAVYLYREAATRPDRYQLSAIRRGQYDQWRQEVATHPDRQPDYGPATPQAWGATVIGARDFLIAYNLFLNTDNVTIAQHIAKAIRASSGGLSHVQALGFLVNGQAQVSINLLNFRETPLYRVQEAVKAEASKRGVHVTQAELIGLIPQQALLESSQWYLQLPELPANQIIETHLQPPDNSSPIPTPNDFITAVAAPTPVPAGGSVSATVGALAAALTQLVIRITLPRKRYVAVADEMQVLLDQLIPLQAALTEAIVHDTEAFNHFLAVRRDKTATEEARQEASYGICRVPLQVVQQSWQVARLAYRMVQVGNKSAVTDAATAVIMAQAAIYSASLSVKINVMGLPDRDFVAECRQILQDIEKELPGLVEEAIEIAAERGQFER